MVGSSAATCADSGPGGTGCSGAEVLGPPAAGGPGGKPRLLTVRISLCRQGQGQRWRQLVRLQGGAWCCAICIRSRRPGLSCAHTAALTSSAFTLGWLPSSGRT